MQWQIRECNAAPDVESIALRLVGYLDDHGYVRDHPEFLQKQLGCTPALLEAGLELLQQCEPRGVGARSLQECLLLQLGRVPQELASVVACLIRDHLEDVANGRVPAIAKRLSLPPATVQRAVDALRLLNPKPAAAVLETDVHYVIPDVMVQYRDGRYIVVSNDGALSEVVINPRYAQMMQQTDDRETQKYLWKKYHAAQWLIRCIEQRRQTVCRVAEAIVAMQERFFEDGISGLRPLTLRQVADMLEVHESTVSRAVRGKYMQTPRGVFEFKSFSQPS